MIKERKSGVRSVLTLFTKHKNKGDTKLLPINRDAPLFLSFSHTAFILQAVLPFTCFAHYVAVLTHSQLLGLHSRISFASFHHAPSYRYHIPRCLLFCSPARSRRASPCVMVFILSARSSPLTHIKNTRHRLV